MIKIDLLSTTLGKIRITIEITEGYKAFMDTFFWCGRNFIAHVNEKTLKKQDGDSINCPFVSKFYNEYCFEVLN